MLLALLMRSEVLVLMAVYELTLRFEAGSDQEALEFAVDVEPAVKGETVLSPMEWARQRCVVERLTKIVVTHMPVAGGLPC